MMTNFKRDLLLILLVIGFLIVFAMMRTSIYEDLNFDEAWSTAIDFLVLGLALAFVVFIGLSILTVEPAKSEEDELMDEMKQQFRETSKAEKKKKIAEAFKE